MASAALADQPQAAGGPPAMPVAHLAEPFAADGVLHEWGQAVGLPLRRPAYLMTQQRPWRGPADASAELYWAWEARGLCVAAIVRDDHIANDRTIGWEYWKQDCLEIFVDGRAGEKLLSGRYTPGAYQIFIRPPIGQSPPNAAVHPHHGRIDGLLIAGRQVPGGYTIELLIPWSAFPDLTPADGAIAAIAYQIDDYDPTDGTLDRPIALSYRGIADYYRNPSRFLSVRLVERLALDERTELGGAILLDVPAAIQEDAHPVAVELGAGPLAEQAHGVRLVTLDVDGRPLAQIEAPFRPLPEPWARSRDAQIDWPQQPLPAGTVTVRAEILAADGRILGHSSRTVLVVGQLIADTLARIERANLPALASTDPFKASQWLGAAATLERIKRQADRGELTAIHSSMAELEARLNRLEGKPAQAAGHPLLDLLELAAVPEAQVVVEFPRPREAIVTFNCGSIPVTTARVALQTAAVEEDPARRVPAESSPLTARWQRSKRDGRITFTRSQRFDREPVRLADLNPQTELFVISVPGRIVYAIDPAALEHVTAMALCVMPEAPAALKEAAETWAARWRVPSVGPDELFAKRWTLVVGPLDSVSKDLAVYRPLRMTLAAASPELCALDGERAITVQAPSLEMAEYAAGLVLAGRPITPEQVDELAKLLLAALPETPGGFVPPQTPLPGDSRLLSGDVHMHSFYSDGESSPVGLVLQAMYCHLDYAVVTDHNTLRGAMLARQLFERHAIRFPVIVGQEITGDAYHLNAFPLERLINPKQSPSQAIDEAAQAGAFVQWCHPGYPWSHWAIDQMAAGIAGTGLHAWEHLPPRFESRHAAEPLPLLTGGTDTHSGIFGQRPERTLIFAAGTDGTDLAAALKARHAAALLPTGPRWLYGPDAVVDRIRAELSTPAALRQAHAERLTESLKRADVPALLRASNPRPQVPEEANSEF